MVAAPWLPDRKFRSSKFSKTGETKFKNTKCQVLRIHDKMLHKLTNQRRDARDDVQPSFTFQRKDCEQYPRYGPSLL